MVQNLKILVFLMMAIGTMYAFDNLNQGPLSPNKVTGLVVSEQRIAQQDVNCYDSDNRDHYSQGTTYAKLFAVNGEAPKQDVCEGNSLIEYYCVFDEPQVEFYDCEYGCRSGACM